MHCCHALQLLPCVWIDFFIPIKTHAATVVPVLAFDIITAIAALRDVVVIVATRAACVSFADESGGSVEQEEAATGLYILFHRIHYGCREERKDEETQ